MPQFAANLSMLFTELPFIERFARAAHAGFNAVECQFPYEVNVEAIRYELDQHKLRMILHNLPAGNWAKGERGIACHPDRVGEFKQGVEQAIGYAQALGVKKINCLAGILPQGISSIQAHALLVTNLRYAANKLATHGIDLLIEPVNTFDIPGFFVNTTDQALSVLDEMAVHNAYVQYDIYHAQRMKGELTATISKHLQRIGHIQIADNPGRHEPGTGEINYAYLFTQLDRMGYQGFVGCEYKPAAHTESGLGWREQLTRQA
jgi:hydroxypyruvate isomerase